MKLLTTRQEKLWTRKMVELEKRFLTYHSGALKKVLKRDEPDGSFCMSAFKDGYYLRSKERG